MDSTTIDNDIKQLIRNTAVANGNNMPSELHFIKSSIRLLLNRNKEMAELKTDTDTIANSVKSAIAFVGADQSYYYANSHYAAYFNHMPVAMVGKQVKDVIGEDLYRDAFPYIYKTLYFGECQAFSIECKVDAGMKCNVKYLPSFDASGFEIEGFFVIMSCDHNHNAILL